ERRASSVSPNARTALRGEPQLLTPADPGWPRQPAPARRRSIAYSLVTPAVLTGGKLLGDQLHQAAPGAFDVSFGQRAGQFRIPPAKGLHDGLVFFQGHLHALNPRQGAGAEPLDLLPEQAQDLDQPLVV